MTLELNKTYLTKAGHIVKIENVDYNKLSPFSGTIKNGNDVVRVASFKENGNYSYDGRATTFDIVKEVN
jgi:hypothetical protein